MTAAPSLLARLRDRDHTQGNLLASVLALAAPSIATSVIAFGSLQMGDLYFLGQLGPESVAAAGAVNQTLRQVVFLLLLGISTASQMFIARLIGGGDVDGAEHVAGQTLLIGGALYVIAASVGLLFAEPLVGLVATDPVVAALGIPYLQTLFPLLIVNIANQLIVGMLMGAGDTTTPLLASLVITPVALVAEWALAFGHWGLPALGIQGIALGAGLGVISGVFVLAGALFGGRTRVHVRRRHLKPDPEMLRRLLSFAWQPSLHMLARTTIVIFFMGLAGRLGGPVQAAYTIGLRLEMLAIMIAFPVANACATLVGQNLGAGSVERAWRAIWVTFAVELALLWPIAATIFLLRHSLVTIFTQDPEVAALAAEYLAYSSVILGFYGLYFASFRTLQAAGDMNSPMIISIGVALFVGVPLAFFLSMRADYGATGMWIANLCYALVNAALMITWLLRGRWAERASQRIVANPPS